MVEIVPVVAPRTAVSAVPTCAVPVIEKQNAESQSRRDWDKDFDSDGECDLDSV